MLWFSFSVKIPQCTRLIFYFLEGDEKDETDLLIKSPQRLLLIQKHTQTRHRLQNNPN